MNKRIIQRTAWAVLSFLAANSYLCVKREPLLLWLFIPVFLAVNILPGFLNKKIKTPRVCFLSHGASSLHIFVISVVISAVYHGILLVLYRNELMTVLWSAVYCYCAHFILFWNGIISVYITSCALGIKHRVVGALLGPLPVLQLVGLHMILKVTSKELESETKRECLNYERRNDALCKTKYPLLFVHGVFFRDFKYFNYWGRIPTDLKANGAVIYYGNHQSALSIEDSAKELDRRIRHIVETTGCERVNVIAHSKCGLDTRYAMHHLGTASYIASLTTVNTPHSGCKFAEHLLSKISKVVQDTVARAYNSAARHLGDTEPDFMAAVTDLTASRCKELFSDMPIPEGVYCQSFGSVLRGASGGRFPLNFSYSIVKEHDGENDGLVCTESFAYGERCTILEPAGKRGISHGDMIDLNREDIEGFDVRELYVDMVSHLRQKGL